MTRACLWLRVSTDTKGQDPALQRADLECLCQQRQWEIVKVYEVEESAFGKKPREQFAIMLEDARKGKFDVLVVWSMDRFSREGEWSVFHIIGSLQEWKVRFFSYNEEFLDTSGPLAGILIPLFAWIARQDSIRKGRAVSLGMAKAAAQGKAIGRPAVVDRIDRDLVLHMRSQNASWKQIVDAHPVIRLTAHRRGKPSPSSIRRVWEAANRR